MNHSLTHIRARHGRLAKNSTYLLNSKETNLISLNLHIHLTQRNRAER